MAEIRRLPEQLINQIAAGEVVERPSSVVKELVENALDAGASAVEVVLERGGRRRIRVVDDGCGMAPDDARMALERHATSKLSAPEDLAAIGTLGFRGEALPAIASVSRLTLVTAAGGEEGVRLEVEAGTVRTDRPEARPRGTTVEVEDLFLNTPARAKFLRSAATELQRSAEMVQASALARPDVRFRLAHDGRELLEAPPAKGPRDRIRQIFGVELAEGLLSLEAGRSPLRVTGFVSRPAFSRASRSLQFLFVNGRFIGDRTLAHAVAEACRPHFPRDRFPALFLFLAVPAPEVDVNVHPAKREVRFRTPGAVHDLVQRAVAETLSAGQPVQAFPVRPEGASGPSAVADALEAWGKGLPGSPRITPRAQPAPPGPKGREEPLPGGSIPVRVLGQLRDAYILAEDGEGLLLVDQHAAHERLLYDRYREELRSGRLAVQSLLFPVTVEVPPDRAARCEEVLDQLSRLGFAAEVFGKNAFAVRRMPSLAAGADPSRLVRDLLDQLGAGEGGKAVSDLEHRVAALSACHAAVRAGVRLDRERMQHLVETLLTGGHPLTCPHGRPATLRYPIREIERAFLRP